MAGIFGNQGVSSIPQTGYGGSYGQQTQSTGIPTYAMQTREGAEQYPLQPGSTAILMNYNGRKFWIKTQHPNGLAYDFEEMIFFTPAELQQYNQQIIQQAQQSQPTVNQVADYVSRQEFDDLKKQFEEFIK